MNYVTFDVNDRVGLLTMNYKDENRFHPDFMSEVLATLDSAEKDPAVGAIVFTGANPKFFSNGLDLEWIMMNMADPAAVMNYLKTINLMYKRVCIYPKPIVAALNGHTFAGGLFLAAHMDFRFMREDRGWICLPEVDINIPLLPGMIAICQATMTSQGFRELYYSARRMTGPEAAAIGFADRLFPENELLPKSIEFASALAKKKTATYAEMKYRIRGDIAKLLDEVDPGYFAKTLSFSMPSK
ncbi:MAG TPA: enoyl-CoA hydratase/isomerase family protein [bacterium]|nr:enoyl-CoA hydratase/isomerase family protein [bacterium]